MMQFEGMIATVHRNARCVAAAIAPDNMSSMQTTAEGDTVTTMISGTQMRSVIASVDDYLMNLAIADDACQQSGGKTPGRSHTMTIQNQSGEKSLR